MEEEPAKYLAELMTVMLASKYRDKVNEFEIATADSDFMDAEIDEAKDAAIWTMTALVALGYRLIRSASAPSLLHNPVNN